MLKGLALHPKVHSIKIFTDTTNVGWDASLKPRLSPRSVVRLREKIAYKCFGDEGSVFGLRNNREEPTRWSGHSPVESHELVPTLQNLVVCQAHPRVSKCDCQLIVQVDSLSSVSGAINRVITAPPGV